MGEVMSLKFKKNLKKLLTNLSKCGIIKMLKGKPFKHKKNLGSDLR